VLILLQVLAAGCAHQEARSADPAETAGSQVISIDHFDGALLAAQIFRETNRVRAENGVAPLARVGRLDSAADEQADHMALMLRSEHANPIPGEHTAVERVERAGFSAARVGENALMEPLRGSAESPDRDGTYERFAALLVRDWMSSPGHRANILDSSFTRSGCAARIAHALPADQRAFAVQVFCQPDTGEPSMWRATGEQLHP
jgi:uncharacterized protein YkwD